MNEEKYFFEKEIFSKGYKFKFPVDKELLKVIFKFKKGGSVLDIGVGDNGTCLKLAELGFDVTCIDISPTCIKALNKEAKRRKLKIRAICMDVEKFRFKKKFDVIIARGILHFLNKNKVKKFLEKMKKYTNQNGINIIEVFLKGSKCEKDSEGYYFSKGELPRIYSNWKIIENEVYKDKEGNINEFIIVMKNKKNKYIQNFKEREEEIL